MAEAMSENELRQHIEGCKNGNRLSQQWVFDRYYRLMFGVCLRYTNDTDRVQDMVQEGFLKVFTNIEGYTSKGSFEGWMRRIMVNTAIDAIRKVKADRMDATDDEHLEVLVGGRRGGRNWARIHRPGNSRCHGAVVSVVPDGLQPLRL